jgi:polyisoprenoid-binding protein YceI
MKNIITVILGLLLFVPAGLTAEFWNLPSEVNLQNASVSFEVDSTWHLVEGKVGDLSGKVWLNENSDYRSVRAEIKLAVKSFDTDGESRDRRMLEILRAEQYPEVVFKISENLSGNCNPAQLENGSLCEEKITGDLVINGVSKKVLNNKARSRISD